jgi:hypothetical protein
MEAATRLAWLSSDLAAAAGPSLGSAKAPALATAWRRLVGYQRHVPVLPVRPHDARARAHISCIVRFEGGFADFKICNESGEQLVTFGFADDHEARIARGLMIRAISKAVLVVPHARAARQKGDASEQIKALRRLFLNF